MGEYAVQFSCHLGPDVPHFWFQVNHFFPVPEVKKTTELPRQQKEEDLLHCFGQLKSRMQRCGVTEREYTEGESY